MAYDEDLANLIRELIADADDVSEQSMFGGLAFLIGGNMSVAASGQGGLLVRVDPEETEALDRAHEAASKAFFWLMGGLQINYSSRFNVFAHYILTSGAANFLLESSRLRALEAYRFFIRYYALLGLKERLQSLPPEALRGVNRQLGASSPVGWRTQWSSR